MHNDRIVQLYNNLCNYTAICINYNNYVSMHINISIGVNDIRSLKAAYVGRERLVLFTEAAQLYKLATNMINR